MIVDKAMFCNICQFLCSKQTVDDWNCHRWKINSLTRFVRSSVNLCEIKFKNEILYLSLFHYLIMEIFSDHVFS